VSVFIFRFYMGKGIGKFDRDAWDNPEEDGSASY
jgi:hypothetical protein